MAKLDPADDYPDSATQNPNGLSLLGELDKPSRKLRAWVAGSPRRSLSPGEKLLVTARVEVVASAPGGGHYLSRSLLRPPQGTEVGRWKIERDEVDVGRRVFILPEGLAVRALGIRDDKTLQLALTVDGKLAKRLGLANPEVELTLSPETLDQLPRTLQPQVAPIDAVAAILLSAGVSSAGLAAASGRLETARKAPKPTQREFRALVEECLATVRPALIADLRRRVFRYRFPPGTVQLSFEVFYDDLSPLPILGYPCDATGDQMQVTNAKGGREVAPYLKVLPEREVIPARLQKRFARFGDGAFDHVPLVLRWFVACWKEAGGGQRFPLRASIQTHDSMKSLRLPSAAPKARPPK